MATTKAPAATAAPAPTQPLPGTREELLALHKAARARRNAAVLGGHEWEQAQAEVGRIEVEIARIERAMDPPRV
ncbi:MAG TPA: hypothetical protein VFL03_09150 [Candidatus Limnocylindrales bacterium]|nr:hypothetical protein [Candidatus Limnocylindrales bacterium]